jgi:hypothetical protein
MANAHRHKQRVLRGIDDDLAADFDAATRQADSDRSNITRQLWEWYVGRPGAQLPERPSLAGEDSTSPPGPWEEAD